jgi:hypothetical protein
VGEGNTISDRIPEARNVAAALISALTFGTVAEDANPPEGH